MLAGHLWGTLAVEVTNAARALTREVLRDVWGTPVPGTVTARTPATAGPAVEPRIDWFLDELTPLTYRSGGDPDPRPRVLGLTLGYLVTFEQPRSGPTDAAAITAMGALAGRISDRPLRLYASAVWESVVRLDLQAVELTPLERAAVFHATGRPLARCARFRITASRGAGEPDIPGEEPTWLDDTRVAVAEAPRIVVVRGGTAVTRATAAASAVGDATMTHVDLDPVTSPWIGETEKNLSRVLEAAARDGAVLMFDEADALFGTHVDVARLRDAGATLVITTGSRSTAKRLAALGAEVVDAE